MTRVGLVHDLTQIFDAVYNQLRYEFFQSISYLLVTIRIDYLVDYAYMMRHFFKNPKADG